MRGEARSERDDKVCSSYMLSTPAIYAAFVVERRKVAIVSMAEGIRLSTASCCMSAVRICRATVGVCGME